MLSHRKTCSTLLGLMVWFTVAGLAQDTTPAEGSGFRYTYPVRDTSGRQTVAASPTSAPASTADAVPAPPAPSPGPSRGPLSQGPPQVAADSFETVGQVGDMPVDVGEGRFERGPFRYSFAVYEGYNSNVNTQPDNGVESLYTELAAGISYEFGSSRLQLTTSLTAALSLYYNNSELRNDGLFPTINFLLGANYSATPQLDLSFATTTSLLSQPSFTVVGAPDTDQGDYIISNTTMGAKYLWLPKFATETTYNPLIFYYFDPGANTTDFSRVEQTIGQQFLFLWKPTTSLVAEYRFNTRNYFYAKNYDSIGNYGLLGVDHTLNPRSSLSFRGGVEQRINQNPDRVGTTPYLGPYGQLTFNYSLNPNTAISLGSRYGTTASNLDSFNQGQQFSLNLNLQQQITRRIAANAFFNYQNNYYNQPDSDEPEFYDNVFNTGVNVSFQVTRLWSLLAGYTFSMLDSTNTGLEKDYTQNIAYIGAELDF
jgi:hypothetical protein